MSIVPYIVTAVTANPFAVIPTYCVAPTTSVPSLATPLQRAPLPLSMHNLQPMSRLPVMATMHAHQ